MKKFLLAILMVLMVAITSQAQVYKITATGFETYVKQGGEYKLLEGNKAVNVLVYLSEEKAIESVNGMKSSSNVMSYHNSSDGNMEHFAIDTDGSDWTKEYRLNYLYDVFQYYLKSENGTDVILHFTGTLIDEVESMPTTTEKGYYYKSE
jgi:uncharacterized protein YxeA